MDTNMKTQKQNVTSIVPSYESIDSMERSEISAEYSEIMYSPSTRMTKTEYNLLKGLYNGGTFVFDSRESVGKNKVKPYLLTHANGRKQGHWNDDGVWYLLDHAKRVGITSTTKESVKGNVTTFIMPPNAKPDRRPYVGRLIALHEAK